MQYLKKTCSLYESCSHIDIKAEVEEWYGSNNIPLLENTGKVNENIEKYKDKPIQKTSIMSSFYFFVKLLIKMVNKLTNSNIEIEEDSIYQKYELYNINEMIYYYSPFIYLSFVLLYFNDFKSLINIKENLVIKKCPNPYIYMFLIFCIISVILIANGLYKIYKCLNDSLDKFYMLLVLYGIIYVIFINIILPLFINNIDIGFDKKIKVVPNIIFTIIVSIIFIVITLFTFIKKRIITGKIALKDSVYFALYNKYIKNIIILLVTILLVTSIIIKITNLLGNQTFFTDAFLGIAYFIYIIVFYVNIYSVINGNNYNKFGLYSILLIILIMFVVTYFIYDMVNNLKKVCEYKIEGENSLEEDTENEKFADETLNPVEVIKTTIVNILLLLFSIYLFGMIYTPQNWESNRYKFYFMYSFYTIIIFTASLYTIKNSTTIFTIIWFIITAIQFKYVCKLLKFIFCIFKSLFTAAQN